MGLKIDLETEVAKIFRGQWTTRDGRVVPDPEDVGLSNDGVTFSAATVLYADLSGSTRMVDKKTREFSAEVYKAYLYSAAKIIGSEGGEVTAYDGDRIMAVFLGDSKNTSAARCALKISFAVSHIVNPALKRQYSSTDFQLQQVVGIDTSQLMAARTGARGNNDLVWVGRAANYAAKLTELSPEWPTWISGDVYDGLHESVKTGGDPRRSMWEERTWTATGNMRIYRSGWWWSID